MRISDWSSDVCSSDVEPALLVGRGCFRRIAGFALERAVHALVAAVLLRLARIDPPHLNPHLRPARREPRQPAGASRGKRRTLVAAPRPRPAVRRETLGPERTQLG